LGRFVLEQSAGLSPFLILILIGNAVRGHIRSYLIPPLSQKAGHQRRWKLRTLETFETQQSRDKTAFPLSASILAIG
jgi:hypothetical protein